MFVIICREERNCILQCQQAVSDFPTTCRTHLTSQTIWTGNLTLLIIRNIRFATWAHWNSTVCKIQKTVTYIILHDGSVFGLVNSFMISSAQSRQFMSWTNIDGRSCYKMCGQDSRAIFLEQFHFHALLKEQYQQYMLYWCCQVYKVQCPLASYRLVLVRGKWIDM